jgi:hypothetical protein
LDQRIAFVTCGQLPAINGDDQLVADALESRGFQAIAAAWSDSAVDWRQFASVVIRAAWDYHRDESGYAAWLRRCEREDVNLWNPAATVLANIDKRYLARFAEAGVCDRSDRIRGARAATIAACAARASQLDAGRRQAGGLGKRYGTWRTSLATAADDERKWEARGDGTVAVAAPFADEWSRRAKWSIVFFAGEYSHSVLKKPAPGEFRVQEELGGHGEARDPSPAIVEEARRVLSYAAEPLLYARVDGIERDGGSS